MNSSSSRIIIAGGSHAKCLGVPNNSVSLKPELIKIDERFDGMTGVFPRNEAYWTELINLAPHRTIAILWNGNQHYGRLILAETPPVDLILPDEPLRPIDPKATIVPVLRINELWQSSFIELMPLIDGLKSREGCRPFLVGTPPPSRSDEKIRAALIRKEEFFLNVSKYFNIDLATADLTPRSVMYKLWATIQSSMREIAQVASIPFLEIPRTVQTEHGFLKDEYSQDLTHANSSYGTLMRAHIEQFVANWGKGNASL